MNKIEDSSQEFYFMWRRGVAFFAGLILMAALVSATVYFSANYEGSSKNAVNTTKEICFVTSGDCSDYPIGQSCDAINKNDLHAGINCTKICIDDQRSFKCKCLHGYIWDDSRLECVLKCINNGSNTTCIDHSTSKICILENPKFGEYDCETICTSNQRSFKCECPPRYKWDYSKLQCILKCSNNPNTSCSDYPASKVCILGNPKFVEYDCVPICIADQSSFKCKCPPGYKWDESKLQCILKCIKNSPNTSCSDYPTAKFCIIENPKSDGHACVSICYANQTSYKCECPQRYKWDESKHECILKCINNSSNASCIDYPTSNACILENLIFGQFECETICAADQRNYKCECFEGYKWNGTNHECVLKCSNSSNSSCSNYPASKVCSFENSKFGEYDCETICIADQRSFKCKCPQGYIWVEPRFECVLKCIKNYPNNSCSDYPSANICNLENPKFGEYECVSLCDSSVGPSYRCLCVNGTLWNPYLISCEICPEKYTYFESGAERYCLKLASLDKESHEVALNLCSGPRTHLPIIKNKLMLDDIAKKYDSFWTATELFNGTWLWRMDSYNSTAPITYPSNLNMSATVCTNSEKVMMITSLSNFVLSCKTSTNNVVCQYDPL